MAMNLQKSLMKNVLKFKVCSTPYYILTKQINKNYCSSSDRNSTKRFVSTLETKSLQKAESGSLLKNLVNMIPFVNIEKTRIKSSGYMLYEDIADNIDYINFFEKLNLPDTFYSWFAITELHIWMLSVRAMAEGDSGKLLRASVIEALWNDVGQRVKKLGAGGSGSMSQHVYELHEQLQAAFIGYDEGLQSDDIVLAGAIWRRFYQMNYTDPSNIEKLVKYIRKQMILLDNLPREQVFRSKPLAWESLSK